MFAFSKILSHGRRPPAKFFVFAALGLLGVHAAFFALNWHRYPTALDTPFHLLMGKMFADGGRVALWDHYEFAPFGRPNLYPPLLHVVVWLLRASTGLAYLDIGRFMAAAQTMAALLMTWAVSAKFFDAAAALFALIFLASNSEFWWWQTSVSPAALCAVLVPAFLWAYFRRRRTVSALLLTFSFYLHYGVSAVMVVSMGLAALAARRRYPSYVKDFCPVVAAAAVFFGPWLYHVFRFRHWLLSPPGKLPTPRAVSAVISLDGVGSSLNIFLALCLAAGAFLCYKKRGEDFKYLLFFSFFCATFLFLFLFEGGRFHAFSAAIHAMIAGYGARAVFAKISSLKKTALRRFLSAGMGLLVFVSIFFQFPAYSPSRRGYRVAPLGNEIRAFFLHAPFLEKERITGQNAFDFEESSRLAEFVRSRVKRNEVIHMNIGDVADYITLETGVRTDTGMYWENVTQALVEDIRKQRTSGWYVSSVPRFFNLLPPLYIERGVFPRLVERIGKYYIGYLGKTDAAPLFKKG